jgi:hypothetical protein
MPNLFVLIFVILGVLSPSFSYAIEAAEDEHFVAMTVATTSETEVTSGHTKIGVALGMEISLIENWFELELQTSALGRRRGREYSNEIIFKTPFQLSKNSEFEVGVGLFAARAQVDSARSASVQRGKLIIGEFKQWTSKTRGWFIETSLGRASDTGEKTLSISVGLIFGL